MSPYGGDKEARTLDPLLAKQVLSQLSYTPTLSRFGLAYLFEVSLFTGPSKSNNIECSYSNLSVQRKKPVFRGRLTP